MFPYRNYLRQPQAYNQHQLQQLQHTVQNLRPLIAYLRGMLRTMSHDHSLILSPPDKLQKIATIDADDSKIAAMEPYFYCSLDFLAWTDTTYEWDPDADDPTGENGDSMEPSGDYRKTKTKFSDLPGTWLLSFEHIRISHGI